MHEYMLHSESPKSFESPLHNQSRSPDGLAIFFESQLCSRTAVASRACNTARHANGRFIGAGFQRRDGRGNVVLVYLGHWLCPLIAHFTSSGRAQHMSLWGSNRLFAAFFDELPLWEEGTFLGHRCTIGRNVLRR